MSDQPTKRQVVERYDTLWHLSYASERVAGAGWYPQARYDILSGLGSNAEVELTLVRAAILSPQLTWTANIQAARASRFSTERPAGVIGSFWNKAMAATWLDDVRPDWVKVALSIDPKKAPKTYAFANALLDPTGPWAVIDRHMFDAAWLTKGAHLDRWSKNPIGYRTCAEALVEVASRHHIPAPHCQATIWLVWKSLSNNRQAVGTKPLEVMGYANE